MSSNGNNNRLRRVQRITEQSSWRTNCKRRKRQIEGAAIATSSSRTSSNTNSKHPFQIDQLPLNTLVIVASQLPFADFKDVGLVSKKFNIAQRVTRYSRKCISVDLLRKLFPDEAPLSATMTDRRSDDDPKSDDEDGANCVGMLQVMRPLRYTLRSSPPRSINEVDLSEFSAVRESHFLDLLKSVNNGRELFAEVQRLNVQGCVIEIKDMAFLAQLMPKIWFIRCSARTLVLPESSDPGQRALSAEQMQVLRSRVDNFDQLRSQFTRKHLWFLAQLTELFPNLETVQLDN